MHEMTLVSLCNSLDTFITCLILRTFAVQNIKSQILQFIFLYSTNSDFSQSTFIMCSKKSNFIHYIYIYTTLKFVEPKKCNNLLSLISFPVGSPVVVTYLYTKIIFFQNFPQYIVFNRYKKFGNRSFICCGAQSSKLCLRRIIPKEYSGIRLSIFGSVQKSALFTYKPIKWRSSWNFDFFI